MTTEEQMMEIIMEGLWNYDDCIDIESFKEAGILTLSNGMIVKMDDMDSSVLEITVRRQ